MARSRAYPQLNRRWLACIAVCAGLAGSGGYPAYGQIYIEPVINPSPLIAQGHLEGGINGDGSPRPDGKTPLMLAVEANDLKVIEYLLEHGVDPDLKDAAGETAQDLAQRGVSQAAAGLLKAHASAHPGFTEYYVGKSPVLSAVSATSQSGSPGCDLAHSLVVLVTGRDGNPLADAPVRFAVEGEGSLLTQESSPGSRSLLLRSDGSGDCRVNFHLPNEPNTSVHITACAGAGEHGSKVTFAALTNDGTGGASTSCFDPSNSEASLTTGGVDLSWQNNTDDETAIKIWETTREGRKLMATLPPHSTSAHIPEK